MRLHNLIVPAGTRSSTEFLKHYNDNDVERLASTTDNLNASNWESNQNVFLREPVGCARKELEGLFGTDMEQVRNWTVR